jgi:hypothetical protein
MAGHRLKRQQAILGRGRWAADDLRDIVRDYALETLADGRMCQRKRSSQPSLPWPLA